MPYTQFLIAFTPAIKRPKMALRQGLFDNPPYQPTKTVSGQVFDAAAVPVVGATVLLFRQSDNLFIGATTSIAGGFYSFPRDSTDASTYYTLGYSVVGGITQIHGTSNRGLVAL